VKRKLAAILAADVQGYSRLMGEDEVATLQMLTAYRGVTDALIAQYHGRIVNTAGDSILAEFVSVVDAVQCAVDIQRDLSAKNAPLPESRRMQFRIGLNLGDVMVEGEQLYGDGVNIAARLESLADGGGICLAGNVYEQIRHKLPLQCEDLGEQRVKNIAEPVHVYKVRLDIPSPLRGEGQGEGGVRESENQKPVLSVVEGAKGKSQKAKKVEGQKKGRVRPAHQVAVAGLVLVAAAVIAVRYFAPSIPNPQPPTPSLQAEPPLLPLPDKPSLAVLPFVNMSEDPKQDYFSDGITEDITSALSKISSLFVIARNSAFTYKGKAVKVQDVSRELGVRYVLEGSVRKAGDQVRITAQLIDATTGYHLWSERYDRTLKDIFAVQDEIVQKMVTTLKLQLPLQEKGILVHKTTDNLEAYDYYLRGIELFWQQTKEANAQARQMFERAVELDPQYALAFGSVGRTYLTEWTSQWNRTPQVLDRAQELAQKAVTLDSALPEPHTVLGLIYLQKLQHDQAIAEAERAIALDPNWADGYVGLAFILRWSGRAEDAVEFAKKAMRLNPRYPASYQFALGFSYCQMGRYDDALAAHKAAVVRNPNLLTSHICLAACYSMAGRDEEARAQVKEILRISPKLSLEVVGFGPWKNPADGKAMMDALRKAGLK
jgi:adenylate cyclase